MKFTKNKADTAPLRDPVYIASAGAAADTSEEAVNATVGTLRDEDGNLVALKTVFDSYDEISRTAKASYASAIKGNPAYRKAVYEWVTPEEKPDLAHTVIASCGGTAAVYAAVTSLLDEGEILIIPETAWTTYRLIAETNNLRTLTYKMFDGERFTLRYIREALYSVMEHQKKAVLVVNDPCHNPTGYSMSYEEWEELVSLLNEISAQGPAALIDDIAYADYSFDTAHVHDYMRAWNGISDNVLMAVAFSCSKTLTSYGMRCGAAVLFAKNSEDLQDLENLMEKKARSIWSGAPNGVMENFVRVTGEYRSAYLAEKQTYIDLLHRRSSLFLQEAKEAGLHLYPYREGFFITLREEDADRCRRLHEALMKKHIYTVLVSGGIRIGICSVPLKKIRGLAAKIKEAEDQIL